ncbi:MAG: LON peptidase substrate-binding domain-containing protein [Nitrospira sp.]|nr:LON peptidase substrate-binding domain-containing protein [Nitrospira sp.]
MQTDPKPKPANPTSSRQRETLSIPDRLPVFPLPNVVLFPRTYLPLHIFEPRYRQMVAEAAASHQCIAMALLKDGWEADYYGNPPIYPTLCIGRLVSVHLLPDGRSNILLQGLVRCEIQQEHFEKPYREATIRLKPEVEDRELPPEVRRALLDMLNRYLQTKEDHPAWPGLFRADISDEVLINTLSTHLECTPLEKLFLLEADGLLQRVRRLNDLIQFMLHDRFGAKGWG